MINIFSSQSSLIEAKTMSDKLYSNNGVEIDTDFSLREIKKSLTMICNLAIALWIQRSRFYL